MFTVVIQVRYNMLNELHGQAYIQLFLLCISQGHLPLVHKWITPASMATPEEGQAFVRPMDNGHQDQLADLFLLVIILLSIIFIFLT